MAMSLIIYIYIYIYFFFLSLLLFVHFVELKMSEAKLKKKVYFKETIAV